MLESITLHGFKSFAERTRLEFLGGICAVIGPNGSGKSNVVEALRWATHQARSRELRTSKGTELIFHGSGGKAPLGLAEVQLELRVQGASLSLSRRIYRDGSSEQDLGGKAVRVRDIHAALRGTGLGPGGLAVIGQGEVSGVVQAEGRTLLGYLQEAAGLSRAVSARQDTENRLAEAQRHLHELELIEMQWQERVTQLAQEAQQARQERQYRLRSLALQDSLSRARQEALETEIAALRLQAAQQQQYSERLSLDIQARAAELEAAREAALLAQAEQAAYQQARELLTAAQEAAQQQHQYLQHLEREQGELSRDLNALPQQAPQPLGPQSASDISRQLTQLRETLAQLERHERLLGRQLDEQRQQASQHAQAQARAQAQRDTWAQELAQVQAQGAQTALALQEAGQAQAQAAAQYAQAQAAAQGQQEARAAAQAQAQQLSQQLLEVRSALLPLEREAQRLGQSLDSYARYGEGPRRALSSDHAGIVGSVADLLTVPADYETALQAALGRRLEQVVVQTADDARDIIALLKRQGGRATFLPLDLLRSRPRRDAAFLGRRGVLGNLADLCPSDPPQVAEALLSDTLLLDTLEAATELARQFASRPRLVTLEGEVLEAGGALTGGRGRDTGFSVLADQRRYHELQDELEAMQRRAAQLTQAQEALSVPAPAPVELGPLQQQLQQAEKAAAALEATAHSLQQRENELQRRLQSLEETAAPVLPADPSDLSAELAHLQTEQLPQARQQERALGAALEQARDAEREWQAWRSSEGQRRSLSERLGRNAQALGAQRQQLAHAEQEVLRREQEAQTLRPAAAQQAEEHARQLSQAYSQLIAQQNRLRASLEELQLGIARREGSRQPLPDGALLSGQPKEWQTELSRLRVQLEGIGVVNALAEEEHAAQLERLQQMQTQRQDAQDAASELQAHLQDLSSQEAQATAQAYGRVSSAFAEYSRELLGGSGELEAERDEAGRLTGLRLVVQPRGKRTRNLNLLSAGERTMAGLGFLFALNHAGETQGLPLAVLDEVDAPLDEANIRRFTHFLQVFAAKGAQFILVTHQKATMEVAQTIWGVTTDASGASKLLSIKDGW